MKRQRRNFWPMTLETFRIQIQLDFLRWTRTIMLEAQEILDLCCERFQNENSSDSRNRGSEISAQFGTSVTCCLLSVVDLDYDPLNGHVHPVYEQIDTVDLLDLNSPKITDFLQGTNESLNGTADGEPDWSKHPFINVIWTMREDWEVAVKSIAVIPLIILGVLGNLAVIRVVLKARLTNNPVNLFILNMSIADFLTALIFPWIFLSVDLYQKYVLGNFVCNYEATVLCTLMLTSVLSLTVISYDRLTAVLFPFNKRMKARAAKNIIYCLWIFSFGVSLPISFWRTYKERQWSDYLEAYCSEDPTPMGQYWLLILVILVWIPLFALTVSYTAIVIKLDALEKRQRDHPIKQVKYKSKVIRMFFVVLITFCICWIPYTAFTFIRYRKTKSSQQNTQGFRNLFFISHYLMYVNSALNPIIYGLKNDNLRKEFRNALPNCFKMKKQVSISTVYRNEQQGGQEQQQQGKKMKKKGYFRNSIHFQQEPKIPKWVKTSETYDPFSSKEKRMASLNSFERRNSALEDLGLPVPKSGMSYLGDSSWDGNLI